MHYEIDELLPVAAMLTEKFTSKESTSVTYETARQMMEAVLYCVEELGQELGMKTGLFFEGDKPDCLTAYREGCRLIADKMILAKESYHRIIKEFQDYGCRNYKDTIMDGIPAFFTKYDHRFKPQDHLLTLDYPALNMRGGLKGIDLIVQYLAEIEYEQQFLMNFPAGQVMNLLESVRLNYRELYLDNLCEPVLLRASACFLSDRNLTELEADECDKEYVRAYIEDLTTEQLEKRLAGILRMIEKGVMKEQNQNRFHGCARGFAVRLKAGCGF